jgi:hypothetical protein
MANTPEIVVPQVVFIMKVFITFFNKTIINHQLCRNKNICIFIIKAYLTAWLRYQSYLQIIILARLPLGAL